MTRSVFVAAALVSVAAIAHAADAPVPEAAAPQRFVLAPSITLSDVGIDTNILTTAREPKRDTTSSLKLQIEPSLPLGPARLSGRFAARGTYFRQYTQERSLDTDDDAKFEVRINRLMAHASASYLQSHDRFDPEIFVRTLRRETAIDAGADFLVSGRTSAGVSIRQSRVGFEGTRLGAGLREALNRQMQSLGLWFRDDLTPLTTAAVLVDLQQDHFDFMPARDAAVRRILAGLEFRPGALVDGKAYVGYRAFDSAGDDDSNGRGIVGSIDLGYTMASRFRWGIEVERDYAHSFRLTAPYYQSTRVNVGLTARLGRWEARGGAGRERLHYDSNTVEVLPIAGIEQFAGDAALDRIYRYGGGAKYRLRPSTTLGVDADYLRFHGNELQGTYNRLRIVSSFAVQF